MVEGVVSILFLFLFVPLRFYTLWVNYKGRFRYKLYTRNFLGAKLDKRIGVFSLLLEFIFSLFAVIVISAFVVQILSASPEIGLFSILLGAISWTLVDLNSKHLVIKRFEKNCIPCRHKNTCLSFHHDNCTYESINRHSKSATLYEKNPI